MNRSAKVCPGGYEILAQQRLQSGRVVILPLHGFGFVGGSGKQESIIHCSSAGDADDEE